MPRTPLRETNQVDRRYRAILTSFFGENLSRSEAAKVRIAEAAIAVLGECGFEEFRMEAVAQKARVSRPLVLHYFKDGKALLLFAVQFVRARLHQYIVEALAEASPALQFYKYVEAHFQWLEENPLDAKFWLLFHHLAAKDKRLQELHQELSQIGRDRIEALIAPLKKQGESKKAQAELVAQIQALITGALTLKATDGGSRTALTARSTYTACCQWLKGSP